MKLSLIVAQFKLKIQIGTPRQDFIVYQEGCNHCALLGPSFFMLSLPVEPLTGGLLLVTTVACSTTVNVATSSITGSTISFVTKYKDGFYARSFDDS